MEKRARVLVVEDESIVALDIQECLGQLGYEVVQVLAAGEEVLQSIQTYEPDVILMDIVLKGSLDGIETAAMIRDRFQIPVIYLTGYADEPTLQRAKITDPFGYILKPYEPFELRTAIELALYRCRAEERFVAPQESMLLGLEAEERGGAEDGAAESYEAAMRFFQKISPFSQLRKQDQELLAAGSKMRAIEAGNLILCEGDENPSAFLVISGRVALLKTSASGKELIVELLPPGDLLSVITSLEEKHASHTARAQVFSRILMIPTATLRVIIERNPEMYRIFAQYITNRLRISHNRSRGLAHDRVEVRIASALCALIPSFAKLGGDRQNFTIEITRQELADLTGTTPETAIRVTKNMEREEILDLTRPGIIKIIDREGLDLISEN
jgi:CRP-like cAMP-binding protein/CheY-like chemotaxis protein